MTKPRYLQRCSDGSQECEEASLQAAWSASVRWCVDFNNGNVNNNHIDNSARVRAVRSWSGPSPVGECQGVVSFGALYKALRRARRNKVASANQLAFEAHWPDRLFTIQERLNTGTWSPSPTNCFVACRPKAREIHAPDFGDRVVHHWLVPHLEAIYEPRFIFDSHANRVDHGTHAAVDRVRGHIRQVASGQGGKFRLAPWVLRFFPPHQFYVEPYGGAASVLMLKARSLGEVCNDLDGDIVRVFRILRESSAAAELQRRLAFTPYVRAEFEWSYTPSMDDLEAVHKTIVRSFFGHGSDSVTRTCRSGFRSKRPSNRSFPSAEWATFSDAIPAFTARLQRVVIENRDGCQVMQQFDGPNTLHYVDPPYVHATRSAITKRKSGTHGYRHEMNDADHHRLAETLHALTGMVALSGYPCPLYDRELYAGWERVERKHFAEKGKARTEVLWLNRACSDALISNHGMPFSDFSQTAAGRNPRAKAGAQPTERATTND